MGWLISFMLIIGCAWLKQPIDAKYILIASGLFAIAGSIGNLVTYISSLMKALGKIETSEDK